MNANRYLLAAALLLSLAAWPTADAAVAPSAPSDVLVHKTHPWTHAAASDSAQRPFWLGAFLRGLVGFAARGAVRSGTSRAWLAANGARAARAASGRGRNRLSGMIGRTMPELLDARLSDAEVRRRLAQQGVTSREFSLMVADIVAIDQRLGLVEAEQRDQGRRLGTVEREQEDMRRQLRDIEDEQRRQHDVQQDIIGRMTLIERRQMRERERRINRRNRYH